MVYVFRGRKKVYKMPALAEQQELDERARRLARAKELSDIVTKGSIRAGITNRELEESARIALENVKRRRRRDKDSN
jgi:hypothetical protein